jgi:hypothetical protein
MYSNSLTDLCYYSQPSGAEYLPYEVTNETNKSVNEWLEMRFIASLTEVSAIKSIGLKLRITKREIFKILTQEQLSIHEPALREMIVQTSLIIMEPSYVESLIAAFFYASTGEDFKILRMCFIAETILIYCEEFADLI